VVSRRFRWRGSRLLLPLLLPVADAQVRSLLGSRLRAEEELTLLRHVICDPADRRFDAHQHSVYMVSRHGSHAVHALPRHGVQSPH
jgi:hypothetical protein